MNVTPAELQPHVRLYCLILFRSDRGRTITITITITIAITESHKGARTNPAASNPLPPACQAMRVWREGRAVGERGAQVPCFCRVAVKEPSIVRIHTPNNRHS